MRDGPTPCDPMRLPHGAPKLQAALLAHRKPYHVPHLPNCEIVPYDSGMNPYTLTPTTHIITR